MLLVSIILVLVLLALLFIVDFVLTNLTMFQAPFDIVIRVPFTPWDHKWEGVPFMYIIAGSVLLGALVIVLSTWVLDTRRKLKIRSQRKELKHLQSELQEAKAVLPHEETATKDETPEEQEEPSVTPEQISKSFEDAVEGGDFLEKIQQKDETEESEPSEEEDRSEDVHTESEKGRDFQEPLEVEKKLPQATPVEAEVVESETNSSEQDDPSHDEKDRGE